MNENTAQGAARAVAGKIEAVAGRAVGSDELQARGALSSAEGHAQQAVGSAQDAMNQAAGGARGAVSRARDLYESAQERVQGVADTVDPFVRDRPYAALGVAAVGGLLVGLLLASGRPRVIYLKPRG